MGSGSGMRGLSASQQRQFADYDADHYVRRVRMGCVLMGVAFASFIVVDMLVMSAPLLPFLLVRGALVTAIIALWLVTRSSFAKRFALAVAIATGTTGALGISVLVVMTGGVSSEYHQAILLVFMGMSALRGLSVPAACVVFPAFIVLYDACLLIADAHEPSALLALNNGVLFIGALIGVATLRIVHDSAVAEFLARAKLETLARIDDLTGLPNRRELMRCVERRLADDSKQPTGFIMVDIDHFKRINDTHGHLVGDQALRAAASAIRSAVRPSDVAARYGGEEFAVLLHDADLPTGIEIAERVRQAVGAIELVVRQQRIDISVSCGVSSGLSGDDPADMIRRADDALYDAKNGGRDCVKSRGQSRAEASVAWGCDA